MKTALFYDTETTGLPLFSQPSEDPRQPHIVQLAAILVDLDKREILQCMDVICKPDGWVIPDEVIAIHGISNERATEEGISEKLALEKFMDFHSKCVLRIAHNESFDARIIRIAQHRFGSSDMELAAWKTGKAECTQRLATPIMKLPSTEKMKAAGFFKNKSANLGEAVQHFTGKPHVNAHSALADARACLRVYFAIQDLAAQSVAA